MNSLPNFKIFHKTDEINRLFSGTLIASIEFSEYIIELCAFKFSNTFDFKLYRKIGDDNFSISLLKKDTISNLNLFSLPEADVYGVIADWFNECATGTILPETDDYLHDVYEQYKNEWVFSHISESTKNKTFKEYLDFCRKNPEDTKTLSFDKYCDEYGYSSGMLYSCEEEFIDCDFPDIVYAGEEKEDSGFIVVNGKLVNKRPVFRQYIDLSDISNSLLLDSDQTIASLKLPDGSVLSLEVRGEVRITDDKTGDAYRYPFESSLSILVS